MKTAGIFPGRFVSWKLSQHSSLIIPAGYFSPFPLLSPPAFIASGCGMAMTL